MEMGKCPVLGSVPFFYVEEDVRNKGETDIAALPSVDRLGSW